MRTAIIIGAAGLALCIVSATAYITVAWRTARAGHEVISDSGALAQRVLEAEVNCQRFLMSGDQHSLKDHRQALALARQTATSLTKAAGAITLGSMTLAPAVSEVKKRLAEWEEGYASPAVELKRTGRSQKLSSLNRRGTAAILSSALRDSLDSLHEAAEAALAQNVQRASFLERMWMAGMLIGLAALLAASAFAVRRAGRLLDDLRSHTDALELLAHWAERIQNVFSEDQAVRMLAGTLTRHLGMARATVMLREREETPMRVAVDIQAAGGGEKPALPHETKDEDCPPASNGQRVLVLQAGREHTCDCPLSKAATGGYVCIPLTARGSVIGVVRAEAPDGRPLRRSAMDRVESLVRLTSITLNTLLSLADAKQQATTDGLTGVFNRRFLDAYLEKQVQVALRHSHPLAVLMIDVDRFKAFNDRWGHAAGDALLRAIAAAMVRAVREGDLVARYGGEEFTAVLANTNCREAMLTAERMRAEVEKMTVDSLVGLAPPVATVSIGVACAPDEGSTAISLITASDAALYRAKEGGRNRVIGPGG